MTRTNLTNSIDNSNPIMKTTVKNYFLTSKGLLISYIHNGTPGKICRDPSQTAELLLQSSYIKDYTLYNNLPIILTETLEVTPNPITGEPEEHTDIHEESWRAFVQRFQFDLDDRLALLLVKHYLLLEEAEVIRQQTKDAINMIQNFPETD
jgi:hypothetical protein